MDMLGIALTNLVLQDNLGLEDLIIGNFFGS